MNSGPIIHTADLPSSILGASAHLADWATETRILPMADLEKQAVLGAIAQ